MSKNYLIIKEYLKDVRKYFPDKGRKGLGSWDYPVCWNPYHKKSILRIDIDYIA